MAVRRLSRRGRRMPRLLLAVSLCNSNGRARVESLLWSGTEIQTAFPQDRNGSEDREDHGSGNDDSAGSVQPCKSTWAEPNALGALQRDAQSKNAKANTFQR